MLPKSSRLTRKDLASLKNGKSAFTALISLRYSPAPKSRFAVSVSKKEISTAVDRNRMRRRVYATLGALLMECKIPVHAMLIPKKRLLAVSNEELTREVRAVFTKTGLI